ncbi:M56 family metallopeptidase [Gabonibacter chumensis]|uniref:M56 family metallopeptidase n=1 Tax=Gabonibacter chumensis TaxID=2972474 RepID=UPI0025743DF5|nr:M56 family metallopeptidase [Gabonibacter chumensis]MCR9013123.1 M56 family metallopeptidase [Gabonibacter chumensis]
MGSFFVYILKMAFSLILFYLFYRLLLGKETFHRFNRIALLSILMLSIGIPFWEISDGGNSGGEEKVTGESFVPVSVRSNTLHEDIVYPVLNIPMEVAESECVPLWLVCLLAIYWCGVVFFTGRHFYILFRLFYFMHTGRKERMPDGVTLIVHQRSVAPFSWIKYIVISQKDLEENGREILIHEMAHIRKRHSVDLLLADIAVFFQWFNPASWLLKQELKNIHEYEADDAVLHEGVDAKQYQLLLIKKAAGTRLYSMANSFNHSKLKKRITMMLKEKSSPWGRLKYLYVLPLAALSMAAFARPEISNELKEISTVKVNDLLSISEIDKENNAISAAFVYPEFSDSLDDKEYITKLREMISLLEKRQKEAAKSGKKGASSKSSAVIDSITREMMVRMQTEFGALTDERIKAFFEGEGSNPAIQTETIVMRKDPRVQLFLKKIKDAREKQGEKGERKKVSFYGTSHINPSGSVTVTEYVLPDSVDAERVKYRNIILQRRSQGLKDREAIVLKSDTLVRTPSVAIENIRITSSGVAESDSLYREFFYTFTPDTLIPAVKIAKMNSMDAFFYEDVAADKLRRELHNEKITKGEYPLFYIDNKRATYNDVINLDMALIKNITILKDKAAIDQYGKKAKNGVVLISLGDGKGMGVMKNLYRSLQANYLAKDAVFYLNGKKISGEKLKNVNLSYDRIESINMSATKDGKKVFRVETDKKR